MCGIVIWQGKEVPIKTLFDCAVINNHRGEEDGFGYIDFTNNKVSKTILHFDEIVKGVLDDKRDTDKPKEQANLKRRLTIVKKELYNKSNFVLFHHRKASAGGIHIVNTHPLKIKNNLYYCQNGTISDYWLLRKYFQMFNDKKYKSTTDSEFVGMFVEDLMKKEKDLKKVHKILGELFYSFGVIIRIDKKNKELTIFKDDDRSLYVYHMEDGGILLISEPQFQIKNFKKCYKLVSGVFKLNEKGFTTIDGKIKNVTKKLLEYIEMKESDFCCDNGQCKCKNTIRFGKLGLKDYCLNCLVSSNQLEGVDIPVKSITTSTKMYGNNYYKSRMSGLIEYIG